MQSKAIQDVDGDLIPISMIAEDDLKKHNLVENIIAEAESLSEILYEFKTKSFKLICDYLSETAQKYGESWKGNATLWNYSRTKSIEINIKNQLQFDEKLQIAKEKIFSCIERWSEGANANIVTLVRKAFDTDKRGLVDTKRILTLTTMKLEDQEWAEAMEIIRESIIKTGSKKYVNFKVREDDSSTLKPIQLNYSAI